METIFLRMQRKLVLISGLAALVFGVNPASADDTDVYLNSISGLPEDSEPMVMFSLDFRPNLGSTVCTGNECDTLINEGYLSPSGPYTLFDILRAALRKVFEPLAGVKVGLMLNHAQNSNCAGLDRSACSNGGYIAMGFESFDLTDSNGAKARFHAIMDALPTPSGNVSHSYQGKELFFELFRYLTGQGIYNAHNGWLDYGTDVSYNLDQEMPAVSWDTAIELNDDDATPAYGTPLASAGSCAKIYTVNTMFFVANHEDDSDAAIEAPIWSGGFGSPQKKFADVVRYLFDADLANGSYGSVGTLDGKQNVTSYFLVDPDKINTTTTGYAQSGGTGTPLPLSNDPDVLVATLQDILRQILSVSTTFVAASVPVNSFNRAEMTDNVYIALFKVDSESRPYWVGNIKKLKLVGVNDPTTPSKLIDANGADAVASDGRVKHDALTFWTLPEALPPADTDAGEVDGADGRTVDRGGAGQRIPGFVSGSPELLNGFGGRTIYYDWSDSSLGDFDATSTVALELQADFGASTETEALNLIAFARGLDVDDLDGDNDTAESRPWIFGDPLHSRPLPLNYGARSGFSTTNPAIYIAVASNDGMLRMIKNTGTGGSETGTEAWAFIPRTSLPAQKILRDNAVGAGHPYGVDGAPVAYMEDSNQNGTIDSGENVYLYVGLRRGGKVYYALDVSEPESPRLMWTIRKQGDFPELGYTFSNPRVGLVDLGSGPQPVIMFGGGYDLNKDARSSVGTNDSEGNAIYVVDARTGALIWKARGGSSSSSSTVFQHPELVDSIPSTLTVADTDGNGLTDRIIVGDTGGNVWRADIQGSDTSRWKLTLLASLGRHATGASGVADDRRFFHRPDLVLSQDETGSFDAVLIGSGDRADPLDQGGTVVNHFFMIKDRNVLPGAGAASGYEFPDFGDVTDNCLQTASGCSIDLSAGWRLQMESVGEKLLATAVTIDNTVYFTSYIPHSASASAACTPSEGSGRLYAVNLLDATSVVNYNTTDDDPDNPDDATTKADRFTDLRSAGIPSEVVSVPPNKILRPDLQVDTIESATRWRTFWHLYEEVDNGAGAY